MTEIQVVINGRETSGHEEMTILQAAQQIGIDIPTLCYSPDFRPTGVCRICAVEVEGSRTLVGACHTPIAPGMLIHTHSPKVLAARRANVELLQAAHDSVCVTDPTCQRCELHKLCSDLQVKRTGFRVRERRSYPIEENNPYVRRDMSKCILCRRCISACSEIAKKNIFAMAYRGYNSKVVVDCDDALNSEVCRDCGICIDYCPTNALSRPREAQAHHA
jgi:NADH-quinone oxidoreductase subunit G/formate dehydrogenase alpha subunit